MSDVVIRAENLGKKYMIGHQVGDDRYVALRDVLMQNARTFWRKSQDLIRGKPIIPGDQMEEFWALKDVNFEIRQGEVVGIIGRNGAGKSTLLKVLSRITEPSAGRVTIKGRVASLLEVGTGFHPELTGRENIYLNGAILGMTRTEIRRKFDEIVDFAGVEKFLDTPVKRYSSGMYVRLAFAVAAHLEPEILVIDEVLAVGDAEFQKKCLGKMGDVAQEGRTVLFVSHNMEALLSLCPRALLVDKGHIVEDDLAETVVSTYLEQSVRNQGRECRMDGSKGLDKPIQVLRVSITDNPSSANAILGSLTCLVEYEVQKEYVGAVVAVQVISQNGSVVATLIDTDYDQQLFRKLRGHYFSYCPLPDRILSPGLYFVTISIADMKGERYVYLEQAVSFQVSQDVDLKNTFHREGLLLPPTRWKIERVNNGVTLS